MSWISATIGKPTTILVTLKAIALTAAIVSPIMFYSGWHIKGVFVDAGNTEVAVDANKGLVADGKRSNAIGNKAEDKKEAYHEAVKKLPPVPAGCVLDAPSVSRLSDRIEAGRSARK